MPKNPLKFNRRKSSGTAFDDFSEPIAPPAATSSFRVLERPEKINLNGPDRSSQDRLGQVNRPFNSPLVNLRGKSTEELGSGLNRSVERPAGGGDWLLNHDRGSGGTTNSGSSGYYDSSAASARYSSSSTLPSSVDAERELDHEELFPRKTKTAPMFQNVSPPSNEPLPPPPSFSTRAARAFSFGQKHNKNGVNNAPSPPQISSPWESERSRNTQRERATTTSSYASTAKPEVNLNIGSSDFGADFGSMFDSPKKDRFDAPLPPVPPTAAFHRTESEPMFPPRTHSRNAVKNAPEEIRVIRDEQGSPYGWDRRNSREGLMSSSSPLSSPRLDDDGPAVPPHNSGLAKAFLGKSRDGYALVPERQTSPCMDRFSSNSSTEYLADQIKEKDDSYYGKQNQPEDDRWDKRVELHDSQDSNSITSYSSETEVVTTRLPTGHPGSLQASGGAPRSGAMSPNSSEEGGSLWNSNNTTPKAAKLEVARGHDDSLFDTSPMGPASRAIKPQHYRTESGTPKKMTKAQFERLQRGQGSSTEQSEDEEQMDEYDDEDDAEIAKQMARTRRKQEANMSVYRQQMKKVTGGGVGELPSMPRPSLDRAAASAPVLPNTGAASIHFGGIGGQPPADTIRGKQSDDDDEDVPLGILQAHGFPSSSRPPTRQAENNDQHQRRGSVAASIAGGAGGQGNLPPFARRLPQDPYYGSSIVNPTSRESMGMGGSPSVYGGAPSVPQMMPPQSQSGHPGGLVGVIAGEERAKAARRGSPNPATGAFTNPGMPLPSNMPQMPGMPGHPGMPRTMTMGSMQPPQVYTPSGMGANPTMGMPQMPGMPTMQQMNMMQNQQQPQQQNNDQMQQFMQMQMQVMQNMLAMQQAQMGQTPNSTQQQAPDYLSAGMNGNRQVGSPSQAGSVRGQPANQGRAMTMMHPPTRWDLPQGGPRPNSAMPHTYSPSGLNVPTDGPGPGYTPSIAPSERSNIGMPSRYRPVTQGNDGSGRSQTMTSSTFLPYANGHSPSPAPPRPQSQHQSKSTVKLIDKPKGTPRITSKPVAADEDDDEGWAEMRKKRDDKKKFRFGRKDKKEDNSLGDLYHNFD